ncbi:MAG: cysteine--tRNA ligase [Rhabdochlamydiaceae bacterium]|nr:cysteine--tRNA ligase [Rhabdochlamydiaceae bacterium]
MSQPTPHLKLYNTETRIHEEVKPAFGDTLLMYTCGPTVYNFAHIGNFRTYVFEDLLRRSVQFFHMKIKQVMNLTDIDDKTIKGALQQGITLSEYTTPYINAFFEDLGSLGIQKAEEYPAATDYIQDMITIIQRLMDKGVAYAGSDGSIYFRIESFPSYGRLSHLPLCTLKAGASNRVSADEYDKDQISDFVLWKAYDSQRDGAIFWDSPFGKGRPGWHIECSAMAMKILGESIDIHVGGVDNMFPHHENEIAQCEAFSDRTFVRHWLHAEHLLVDHKKMSKSLGNFYTVRDLLQKGYTGRQIRYMLLQTHYRTQLNFTLEGLDGAGTSVQRILDFAERLQGLQGPEHLNHALPIMQKCIEGFTAALADDLNISVALSCLFDMIREINSLCDQGKVGQKEGQKLLEKLHHLDTVLGILSLEEEEEIPAPLLEALEKRVQARLDKNWKLADEYRDWILNQGYKIEDSPKGARLKKIRRL